MTRYALRLLPLLLLFITLPCLGQPDTTVTPELGGPGFERIAEREGWSTGGIPPEQMHYFADTNARKGGRITVARPTFARTLCAYGKDENSEAARMITGLVYEPLISYNTLLFETLPVLASHWKVGADGQTYFFRIDPTARFSDGYPVTTGDVLATYRLVTDPTILSPSTNSFYEGFDRPVVISKYIFSVHSKTKDWRNMLYFGGISILPAHIIGGMRGKTYIELCRYAMIPGSGPYIVPSAGIIPDSMITMIRRGDWWEEDHPINRGQYNFDSISFAFTPDPGVGADRFVAGQIDLLPTPPFQFWSGLKGLPETRRGLTQVRQIYNDSPVGIMGLVFNMRRPPFNDPRIREAFIRLFDPERLPVQDRARAFVPLNSYFASSAYENPNNRRFPYDSAAIAGLLADAGYARRSANGFMMKKGVPLVVEALLIEAAAAWMSEFKDRVRRFGIDLRFKVATAEVCYTEMGRHNFTLSWTGWGGIWPPNPTPLFHSSLADIIGSNNIAGFKSRQADSLMELEQLTFAPRERVRLLRQLDSILVEGRIYALAWYAPYQRLAYWNKFGHPEFYLGRISDWQAALVTWWVDSGKEQVVVRGRQSRDVRMDPGPTEIRFWPDYDKAHPYDGGVRP